MRQRLSGETLRLSNLKQRRDKSTDRGLLRIVRCDGTGKGSSRQVVQYQRTGKRRALFKFGVRLFGGEQCSDVEPKPLAMLANVSR